VRIRVILLEPDGLPITGNGLVEPTLAFECIAEVTVVKGRLFLVSERLPEGRDGSIIIVLLVTEQSSQVAVSPGIIRLDADSFLVGGNGLVQGALLPKGEAKTVVSLGLIGLQMDRLAKKAATASSRAPLF
jgi:hypothetical protein